MDQFYTEEQRMVRETARRLSDAVVAPAAAAIDRDDVFPRAIYEALAEQGLFGVALREEAGGVGAGEEAGGLDVLGDQSVGDRVERGDPTRVRRHHGDPVRQDHRLLD